MALGHVLPQERGRGTLVTAMKLAGPGQAGQTAL
jgi:hypothetical protein